jgi:predicted HicB family RNase H-like nuclease
MGKKTFKDENPALNFITPLPQQGDVSLQDAPVAAASPQAYKGHAMETKSRRVQLLLQPSLVAAIKAYAMEQGISMNAAVGNAIFEYLEHHAKSM